MCAAEPQEMILYIQRFAVVRFACVLRRSCRCSYEIIINQCKSFTPITHLMPITCFTVFSYTESNFQLSNVKNWEKGQQRPFLQKNLREFYPEGKHRLVPPWCWNPNYCWCWKTHTSHTPWLVRVCVWKSMMQIYS